MSHRIKAFIGKPAAIACLLPPMNDLSTYLHTLPQGFHLLFYDESRFQAYVSCYVRRHLRPAPLETDWTIQYIATLCPTGCIGFVETDYWAGIGKQSAILVRNGTSGPYLCNDAFDLNWGRRSLYRYQESRFPINTVLRELGVVALPGMDEFDSVDLALYRHMPDD